jgi:propanol-preferring alcohol dehydrogenase
MNPADTKTTMHAQLMERAGVPLRAADLSIPAPARGQLLIRVAACGVCRTDLHVVDGELPQPKLPLIPGHEIVGRVARVGAGGGDFAVGERVGIPWLGWTCGECAYCRRGAENLCANARFTGYQIDGGYAEYAVADARYCFRVPDAYSDAEAAPLLCAGLIGYRALRMAGDARRIGLYGFGAAAHILAQLCVRQGREVHAFVRPGDLEAQAFARELGAAWCGESNQLPPAPLDAAIIFAPVGALVPAALRAVDRGGTVVCAGIHMSDIPAFPYEILWGERSIRSVANLTRADGDEFFAAIARQPVRTHVTTYDLAAANRALADLRSGQLRGAAVLLP